MASFRDLPIIARDGLPGAYRATVNGQLYINTLDGSVYQARWISGDDWVWNSFTGSGGGSTMPSLVVTTNKNLYQLTPADVSPGFYYLYPGNDEDGRNAVFLCVSLDPFIMVVIKNPEFEFIG